MTKVKIGIVGTGFIATILAPQIQSSKKARLDAVSSRTLAKAESFVANYPGAIAVEGADQLIARDDVDAVYIATPTSAKEDVASRALTAGKHVLIEKPLHSAASFKRLSALARQKGLVLMDATHFVHHPRTSAMRQRLAALIGAPRSLHTMFYFPFSNRENIRFDPSDEPMGAAGDMAWYSMRAVVEYLAPDALEDIKVFADLIRNGDAAEREIWLSATEKTQVFLDAIWQEIQTQTRASPAMTPQVNMRENP